MQERIIYPHEKLKKTNSLKRVYTILSLYTKLCEGGVDKATFCKRNKISVRTFTRYLAILANFLEEDQDRLISVNGEGSYEIIDSY